MLLKEDEHFGLHSSSDNKYKPLPYMALFNYPCLQVNLGADGSFEIFTFDDKVFFSYLDFFTSRVKSWQHFELGLNNSDGRCTFEPYFLSGIKIFFLLDMILKYN